MANLRYFLVEWHDAAAKNGAMPIFTAASISDDDLSRLTKSDLYTLLQEFKTLSGAQKAAHKANKGELEPFPPVNLKMEAP